MVATYTNPAGRGEIYTRLGVHDLQRVDMRELLARDPLLRLLQHLGRDVDAGHLRIRPEIRQ